MTANKKHVVVLCGGRSAEHEISLISAVSILTYLDLQKYRVSVIGIEKDGSVYSSQRLGDKLLLPQGRSFELLEGRHWLCQLAEMQDSVDMVLPILHGPFGEDGTVQGALQLLNIPYVGAGVWGSAVGMNKIHSKRLLLHAGVPVLPYVETDRNRWALDEQGVLDRVEDELAYPVFIKPANMGSSIGIGRSQNRQDLASNIVEALRFDDFILIERGIEAREIEVSVIGNWEPRASVAGEIVPSGEFYTYEAKYIDEDSQLLIPAPLSESSMNEVRSLALRTYRALQLEGMARVDFLLEKEGDQFWVNEPNTIPGFTDISMYPKLWEASGLSYASLLDELIALGMERHERAQALSVDR